MSTVSRFAAALVIAFALSACADDAVLFVTTTSIAIDADANTQMGTIGYSRYEGVVAPVYENGAAPPVYAHIESDLAFFSPKIKQVYATGDAALIAVKRMKTVGDPESYDKVDELNQLNGISGPLFTFGTYTTLGFKLSFKETTPTSITFGYKRLEASRIPLRETTDGNGDAYASVIATIDTQTLAAESTEVTEAGWQPGLRIGQYIATGEAAKAVASDKKIQDQFEEVAVAALTSVKVVFDAEDPNRKKLTAYFNDAANPSNKTNLKSWINENVVGPVRVGPFIEDKKYRDKRVQAVTDLGIP